MATTRTPVARIDHIHRVRRGKKRPHDDDLARRAYFSALCDEHDKAPASELMAKANTHYKSLGQKPLTVRTAQLWRREYQEHPSAFAAGPNFLRARRCKLSDQQIEEARQFVENHPWNSMREAADKLQARNIPINKTWLSDVRRSDPNPERLKPRHIQTKPALTQAHKRAREVFCKSHRSEPWPIWVWTDEYTIYVNGKRGLIYYARRKEDVPYQRTRKFPEKFQLFAAMTRDRVLPLHIFEGKLNSDAICKILDSVLKEIKQARHGVQCILQHDGASYWNSKESQEFLRHHPLVLSKLIKPLKPGEWPANSPDLNVIENLMAIVKRKVQKRLAKLDDNVPCTAQLYQRYLQEEWNAIPQKTLHNLVDSMPKRLQQCLDKHGDATKY